MTRRSSTLLNEAGVDVTREIASKYDVVKSVADNMASIETLANMEISDLESLIENGIKGLTPTYTFSIDAEGNLNYDVDYTEPAIETAVEEW